MPDALLAGARSIIITPPVGVDLTGFGGRSGPSEGVHDDLRACALYLSTGDEALLIITTDLIGLHHEEVARVRAGISARAGLTSDRVMIGCSHTHSGPATRCLNCLGKQDDEYLCELERRLIGLGAWAASVAEPAQLGSSRPEVSVGINRREWRDGHIVLGVNEIGPTAPYADVLYVDDLQGRPLARLFCHAAHAVTLGGENLLLSGDWPGYAQRKVESCYGPGCVALFLQGCCGNINSHPRGSFEVAEAQGARMAAAVMAADAQTPRETEVALGAAGVPLRLPLSPPPAPEDARRVAEETRRHADANAGTDGYGLRMLNDGVAKWAEEVADLAQSGTEHRTVPFEVQALRIGDLGIVGLPGEVFVEYALNIDRTSPLPRTAVAAYTNGNIGYVPTAAAFSEGGYEVHSAVQFYGTTMQTPESEALILATAAEALTAATG